MSKKSKQLQRKTFSILSSLLMVFTLIIPAMHTEASTNSKAYQSMNPNNLEPNNKISGRLLTIFEESETATFLIKFKEKADTKQAVKEAKEKATEQNVSSYQSGLMQHSAVVSELKTTAFKAQENVKNYLETQAVKGNVSGIHSYFIVNGIAVTASVDVAKQIASFPEVEKILPNETRQIIYTPEKDKPTPNQDENNIEWNVDRIDAPDAWDLGVDGTGTVVASIDTGVEWEHPALKEKYRGYNSETGEVDHDFNWYDAIDGQSEPYDDIDHGTHVTGTMVGAESDGSNQVGVAPGAKWIAVKAFSDAGGFDTDLLDAAEWIIAPRDAEGNERIDLAPDVVNNSWGGGPGLDEWYRDVVIAWRDAGIFPEFSAGNSDYLNPGGPGSIATPANYPESFATGATDIHDHLASFSLRGPSPYDELKPDISAPGVDVRSAVPGGEYESKNGTSMAGPMVSAVAVRTSTFPIGDRKKTCGH